MFQHVLARSVGSVAAVAFLFPGSIWAQAGAACPASCNPERAARELQRLRAEFDSIRDAYAAPGSRHSRRGLQSGRLNPRRRRVALSLPCRRRSRDPRRRRLHPRPPAAAPVPAPETAVPAGAASGGTSGSLPVYGNASAMSKIFNPDIAVIGNFTGAAGSNEIEPRPALQLDEAELSLQAVVDPYARADFFLAASPEGLEVEEGFLTFRACRAAC